MGQRVFNILDNTTELSMTKYIIGEIFSSGRATLFKNPSDQTVPELQKFSFAVLFVLGRVLPSNNSLNELDLISGHFSRVSAQYLPNGQQYQLATGQHASGHSVSSGPQAVLTTDNSLN